MNNYDDTKGLQSNIDAGKDHGQLWPFENYLEQVEKLKQAIGETIYIVELKVTDINMAVHHTDRGYELLDVVEYPRPDPKTNLYPHLILLDDGRGINLGRIEKISIGQAFMPSSHNTLYYDSELLNRLLPNSTRFSKESVRLTSKAILGGILGKTTEQLQPKISINLKDDE